MVGSRDTSVVTREPLRTIWKPYGLGLRQFLDIISLALEMIHTKNYRQLHLISPLTNPKYSWESGFWVNMTVVVRGEPEEIKSQFASKDHIFYDSPDEGSGKVWERGIAVYLTAANSLGPLTVLSSSTALPESSPATETVLPRPLYPGERA